MNTAEVLRKARALIETPESWIQGTFARDEQGNYADYTTSRASRFCMSGAIHRITNERGPFYAAIGWLRNVISDSVVNFNDSPERTHAEVLAAFDKAIALAEGAAQ